MSDDPDFSRRDFLRGLGAAIASAAASPGAVEALTKALGRPLHHLAQEFAEQEFIDGITGLPVRSRQKALRMLLENAKTYEDFGGPAYAGQARAYRDAARLLESGWTPVRKVRWQSEMDAEAVAESGGAPPDEPHQAWATQQEAERGPPEGQTLPGTQREAISAVEVEKPEITAYQPEVSIRQQGDHDTIGSPAVTGRADLAAKTNKQEGERELLQPDESHEEGSDFSRL
jgi:hypothetical protein